MRDGYYNEMREWRVGNTGTGTVVPLHLLARMSPPDCATCMPRERQESALAYTIAYSPCARPSPTPSPLAYTIAY